MAGKWWYPPSLVPWSSFTIWTWTTCLMTPKSHFMTWKVWQVVASKLFLVGKEILSRFWMSFLTHACPGAFRHWRFTHMVGVCCPDSQIVGPCGSQLLFMKFSIHPWSRMVVSCVHPIINNNTDNDMMIMIIIMILSSLLLLLLLYKQCAFDLEIWNLILKSRFWISHCPIPLEKLFLFVKVCFQILCLIVKSKIRIKSKSRFPNQKHPTFWRDDDCECIITYKSWICAFFIPLTFKNISNQKLTWMNLSCIN